jgi:hypothetical protein
VEEVLFALQASRLYRSQQPALPLMYSTLSLLTTQQLTDAIQRFNPASIALCSMTIAGDDDARALSSLEWVNNIYIH